MQLFEVIFSNNIEIIITSILFNFIKFNEYININIACILKKSTLLCLYCKIRIKILQIQYWMSINISRIPPNILQFHSHSH